MSKRAVIFPVITLGVAAVLLFAIRDGWTSWEGGSAEQRTDDAYVRADMTPLSTRISGTVRKMEVGDYETVQPGQVLVQLDDEDYRAVLAEANAALAGARAQLEDNQAAKRIEDTKIENAGTVVTQAESAVTAAKAGVAAVEPDVLRTDLERKRQEALLSSKAATHQQVEQAVADATRFSSMLASRQADLERAEASLASSHSLLEAEKRQREALDIKDNVYRADIQAKQAAIVVANVNLGYTRIVSPTAGAVGERHVQEGQLVAPGMQAIDLVKGDVWIQANYKETQLTNIRKGDVADISVDTFPGTVLHGRVVEIAPASGSQFALLPPDNATGNFTKVVQRIPVKIALDPDHPLQGMLRPGFSVVVTVHASGKTARAEGAQP
ncbi:Type I secretion system, membrane fusion protein LapC [Acidisarcina polymorpha]|uniref:Type I secretion system, membrane fusion protein LapC n=1 Tax=Acidisarcina polymorpha TaxID=2211140 RepID=A0A2Z5G304_9BACT|nr:HlyD family secretion protein [Acidisarcina polymorpha]AXC13478.1 Type I secretion system, membrane fusion protein LapC [Acidisarcina polymorpha]